MYEIIYQDIEEKKEYKEIEKSIIKKYRNS